MSSHTIIRWNKWTHHRFSFYPRRRYIELPGTHAFYASMLYSIVIMWRWNWLSKKHTIVDSGRKQICYTLRSLASRQNIENMRWNESCVSHICSWILVEIRTFRTFVQHSQLLFYVIGAAYVRKIGSSLNHQVKRWPSSSLSSSYQPLTRHRAPP